MNRLSRKFAATLVSLAMAGTLCIAGAVTVSGVAWAARPPVHQGGAKPKDPWVEGAPKTGTITILKCEKKKADDKDTSQTECPTGFKPLKGAKFTLTKVTSVKEGNENVTLDLSKFESWQKIAKLVSKLNDHTIKENGDEITLGTTKSGDGQNVFESAETGEDGQVKFENKDLGLYKVEETKVPDGYMVSDTKSFYMTLPLPEYTTTGEGDNAKTSVKYNYNPTVYPKNMSTSDSIEKVYDKAKFASVKDKVPFTITAKVNKFKSEKALTAEDLQGYKVFDDAPTSAFKTIDKAVVKSVKINGEEVKNNDTTTYYNVEDPIANSTQDDYKNDDANENQRGLVAGHTRILVKFEKAGLEKIADAINACKNNGDTVNVEVNLEFELSDTYKNTKVTNGSVADNDKSQDEIVNKSGFFPAHEKSEKAPSPIIPNGEKSNATIDFGFLQVHKYYMNGSTKTDLAGAKFRIFADKDKAKACAQGLADLTKKASEIPECEAASTLADAPKDPQAGATDDLKTTAATDAKGNFTTPYKVRAKDTVYLVEVEAPQGYALSPEVHEVTVQKDSATPEEFEDLKLSSKGSKDGKTYFWFNLPATGAAGVLIFALAGIGLIAASVILYIKNRKEEEQKTA
ncbi:SpaH/EbpB family LPXTG-anchored major pilin [Gardnerella sp. DNF00502]|uniref:SpaH/EbpB family LPXTG-anchored major pilin n=1 Tax=unclassified Gardnerella TaxID=2628112 RepID=UPI000C9EF450|nr:SpaH/EbpB family LPXTG-anchored major pilin [Gardnerella sp. KA00735]PNP89678.1 pilus assembly protein [Gardnerella sp. KA00735]